MNGSNGENGTFTSEPWVNFEKAAYALERNHDVCIQLARITGNRWAYIAGSIVDRIPSHPPRRIRLNEHYGLVVYCGEKFSLGEDELLRLFRKIFPDESDDA